MPDTILSFIHNATTLLFGVYISAAFLGIRMHRKNILSLLGFSSAVGFIHALIYVCFGADFSVQIYPLIIHLPLILFLAFYYKYKVLRSALSVSTVYMCCQISKWLGLVAKEITRLDWVYYGVRIVITIIVFLILIQFVSTATAQLIQKSSKALLIFAVVPVTYYLFDYITGVYTTLLYSGEEVVAEFLGFALCIAYLLFLLVYFRQYEETRETEQKNHLMEMQRIQSQKEIEANRRSEYAISLLRHDMRHFLANISAYIDNGEYDKAQEYIRGIISYTDKTAIHKYSKNEIVNLILSSYENEIEKGDIDFQHSIQIPQHLSVSDIDLTSILSNALENAIHAVLPLDVTKRHISLELKMNDDKLLISVKNTFAGHPEFVDGIPINNRENHGFGTQSIRYVTEKLKGNCQFAIKDEWFVLRVIL